MAYARLQSIKNQFAGQPSAKPTRLFHLVRHHVTVNVEGCANVCAPHHFLLHCYRGSNRIQQPRPVGVPRIAEDHHREKPIYLRQVSPAPLPD
jgi:hypothetical protein